MNNNSTRSIVSIILPIGLLFSLFLFSQLNSINVPIAHHWKSAIDQQIPPKQTLKGVDNKQKGVHVFGYIDSTNLQPFIQNNFEWITLVPYGGQKDVDSPTMSYYRGDSLRMLRRDSIWKNKIDIAHSTGLKVFLKPHIWLNDPSNGQWRSDIFPTNDNNWKLWQKSYREYIVHYAKIAQEKEVELFCIGTELSRLSIEKSDFWKSLIDEVRSIYTGKITYAANWHNEYEKITFWEELDYIGIQAYFPLTKNKNPSVKQISKGWKKHFPVIKSIAKKYNRKILFTELGYKSTADSAIEPWTWVDYSDNQQATVSFETQANCYEAFFKTVWKKEWFAGVHIWQMRSDYGDGGERRKRRRGKTHLDFTPQGKPAELIIATGFK